jgi:hypothetical protein
MDIATMEAPKQSLPPLDIPAHLYYTCTTPTKENSMKNYENTALLAHKRRVDAQRREAAIAAKAAATRAALRAVGGAK